ncbi:hypothetical protein TSMEX_000274 [Taenia solium]|eukprot:TsM_000098900 transcript=TsM_000098900 gene=TsM_000098900
MKAEHSINALLSTANRKTGLSKPPKNLKIALLYSIHKVEYDFQTWCKIVTHESLKYSFRHNDLTELIYVPYNHMETEQSLQKDWVPFQDEVIVRSTKRLPTIYSEDLDSAPRHRFHIIDPFTGPDQHEIVFSPDRVPQLLGRAYRVLKSKLRNVSQESQFTPWAMTCLAAPPSPFRMIRFAIETCCSMDPFFKVRSSTDKIFSALDKASLLALF